MPTIKNVQQKYWNKISPSDLGILISQVIKRSGEFVLAHPEYSLTRNQEITIDNYARRRMRHEPIAYIISHKEFYGLDFKVNKNVLIPRPETELLSDLAIGKIKNDTSIKKYSNLIIDIGTGSGNIIISIAHILIPRFHKNKNIKFYATDISSSALRIAKQNSKIHKVDKKIKFIQGDLLKPFLKLNNKKPILLDTNCLILSNLPYLSRKVYGSAPADVKKYEPKSALYSSGEGLAHYERLFQQIKKLRKFADHNLPISPVDGLFIIYLEFSPEQKNKLTKIIRNYFPRAIVKFNRDLSGKWRVCEINITPEKLVFV